MLISKKDKLAITFKDDKYTYEQLLRYSQLYADKFSLECKPEKILICAQNSPEWCFAFYGAMRCKSIVVPLDAQSTKKEIEYVINDCRPDIVFISDDKKEMFADMNLHDARLMTKDDVALFDDKNIPATDIPLGNLEDVMLINYTSGTTGNPKGVMLTYKNVMFNIDSVSKQVPIFQEDSNVMVLLPLHHILPLLGSLVAPLYMGGTLHIAEAMNAESIIKTLNAGKVSIIIGVPRLYDMLVKGVMSKINASFVTRLLYKITKLIGSDAVSRVIFSSVHKKFGGHLKYLVSGGAALSVETATILKTLGLYVLEGYGMTETAPMISFTRPGRRKIGYAGELLPNIEAKIAENGEICVKGDNVMKGYYKREEETAQIIKDGWLHTGDMGILDKYGLKITGRIKEIIVTSNGKNINPELLEKEFLNESKYVHEIGIFLSGDILHAAIRPEMTAVRQSSLDDMDALIKSEVERFNAEQPQYKRIKQYHIMSEELPKTRLGKVQRFLLPHLIDKPKTHTEQESLEGKSEVYKMLKAFVEDETKTIANENDHFEIDLSMDSLSKVSLLAYIENTFGINMNEEQMENLNTLAKLTDYIEKNEHTFNTTNITWKDILATKVDVKLEKPGITQWCTYTFTKILFSICYRFRFKGNKKLPNSPCIIVANHRCAIDGFLITYNFSRKENKDIFFFAKEKHWRTKIAQFFARKNNIILMDINKNVRQSLQEMCAVLKKGKNIVIFPEGTRSRDNKMKKFKETFAILSKELNVPIIPVAIAGSESACYGGSIIPKFWKKIDIEVLEPVMPSADQSVESLRDKVAALIEKHLSK
ncbi:MAG: long-chain fatty acid--CoA ligase [Lentimicrobiaceae bacterium]|nr:long-chain fatty acid--CoA ligase [Lentimicrobiaceae bacterium]